jgi:hypothetical protein
MALSNDFVQITQAFDPEATRTLGQAFDMACALLGHTHRPESTIEAAKAGERDPVRLREAGLAAQRQCSVSGARSDGYCPKVSQRVTNSHALCCC